MNQQENIELARQRFLLNNPNPFPLIDLTNQSFGFWTVIDGTTPMKVMCRCKCGKEKLVFRNTLRNGGSLSCGCNRTYDHNKTHGMTRTKEYRAWNAMITRCTNPNCSHYYRYGGRGIKICKRWIDSFENFLADMGKAPSEHLSLDRKNNNGNYTPKNCRWATVHEQRNNTSMCIKVKHKGQIKTIREWSIFLGIEYNKLRLGYHKHKKLIIT